MLGPGPLASVQRESFLRPGPWWVRGEGDYSAGSGRHTPDADPRHVCHNASIAIDPARQLYNGAPAVVASLIDALDIQPGDRVLHVGCGLGYYSALMAHCVGHEGRVVAIEVDDALAAEAQANLASLDWVEVRGGDGTVAIYSALGIRNQQMNVQLGQALMRNPFPIIKRLRRDPHEASPACWFHADAFCLSCG